MTPQFGYPTIYREYKQIFYREKLSPGVFNVMCTGRLNVFVNLLALDNLENMKVLNSNSANR